MSSVPSAFSGRGRTSIILMLKLHNFVSTEFLLIFQMNSLSMSSAIQKLIPLETGQSLADYNKVNATKVVN